MPNTTIITGDLSMEDLAASLTSYEQLVFQKVKALKADQRGKNVVTTVESPDQLGALSICTAGVASAGVKLFSATAYILGKKTGVDIYRLPL